MKAGFLQKLVEKLDRVDPGEVQNFVARLLKEKGFLERVFDALQEGVIVLDAEGVITYLNRGACQLFGLEEEDAEGAALGTKIRGLEWEPLVRGAPRREPRSRGLLSGESLPEFLPGADRGGRSGERHARLCHDREGHHAGAPGRGRED